VTSNKDGTSDNNDNAGFQKADCKDAAKEQSVVRVPPTAKKMLAMADTWFTSMKVESH
jgi:hypothetical protein